MGGTWSAVAPIAIIAASVLALVRTSTLRKRQPGAAPLQRLGIALVATPLFVLLLVGAISVPALFDGTEVSALSPARLADKTALHLGLYLVLPFAGLALIHGPRGLLETARRTLIRGPNDRPDLSAALAAATATSGALIAAVVTVWGLGRAHGGELLSAGGAQVVFSQTTPGIALLLAGVAAVAEELLFRGVLLDQLRRRTGPTLAVAGQGALFGLIHAGYGSLAHVLAATAFGIAMGMLARRRGLLPAVGTHFLVNVTILGFWAGHAALVGLAAVLLVAMGLAAWGLSGSDRSRSPAGAAAR